MLLAHLTSQLVLTLLLDLPVEMDSIYQELTVLLAHHKLQFAHQLLSSKFVLINSIQPLLLETKFHVLLAQLLETLQIVSMQLMQPVVSLDTIQLTEHV